VVEEKVVVNVDRVGNRGNTWRRGKAEICANE